jgi:nitroreductase
MELLEALQRRRAVRAYSPRPIDEVTVRKLLHAAVLAPSAMNAQPWVFAIVQDRAKLKRYSDGAKALLLASAPDAKARHYEAVLRNEDFNVFYDASTLVVIGAERREPYTEADSWLAAENLMLAACDAGLGTCPIGFAVGFLNTPEAKEELGFPSTGVVVAPIIVGYPASEVPAVARREPRILSWTNPA